MNNKKFIIRNYKTYSLYYTCLFLFLTCINCLSYHNIIPLSLNLIIIILSAFCHNRYVGKDFPAEASMRFKTYLPMGFAIILFCETAWYIKTFIMFLLSKI